LDFHALSRGSRLLSVAFEETEDGNCWTDSVVGEQAIYRVRRLLSLLFGYEE
jgi:hypothetical protein